MYIPLSSLVDTGQVELEEKRFVNAAQQSIQQMVGEVKDALGDEEKQ